MSPACTAAGAEPATSPGMVVAPPDIIDAAVSVARHKQRGEAIDVDQGAAVRPCGSGSIVVLPIGAAPSIMGLWQRVLMDPTASGLDMGGGDGGSGDRSDGPPLPFVGEETTATRDVYQQRNA